MILNRIILQEANIYDLRVYAKECGVKSPTSKTKPQLINEILSIQNGELKPINETRRGRKNLPRLSLKEESYFDFYKSNLSDYSDVQVMLNIDNEKDFMIFFDELIKNSFVANIEQISSHIYKMNFQSECVLIEVKEEKAV